MENRLEPVAWIILQSFLRLLYADLEFPPLHWDKVFLSKSLLQMVNQGGVLDGVTLGQCCEHQLCCPLEMHC